jgi:CRISPR/Cas system CMR-associated protein Cmr5 small subunit
MVDQNGLSIVISIIETYLKNQDHDTAEGWLKAAFELAKDEACTWLISDEDSKFRAGVGAAFLHVSEEDQERIKIELGMLKNLSALMQGVAVDVSRVFEQPEGFEAIGLMKLWKEE